jgi:hypothetical protein
MVDRCGNLQGTKMFNFLSGIERVVGLRNCVGFGEQEDTGYGSRAEAQESPPSPEVG